MLLPVNLFSQKFLRLSNYDTVEINNKEKQINIFITATLCKDCINDILFDTAFKNFAENNKIRVNFIFKGYFNEVSLLFWYRKIKSSFFDAKFIFKEIENDPFEISKKSPYINLTNNGVELPLDYELLFQKITFNFDIGYRFFLP